MEKIQIVNINNEDYNYDCRICLETDHQNNLIAPCDCSGTQKYVHIDCLNQWRLENLDNEKYNQYFSLSAVWSCCELFKSW